MNVFANLNEFYERPLIPIAKNERHVIEQGIFKNDGIDYTHWLIALIGEPKEKYSSSYQWQVAIYPSTINRQINFNLPLYVSTIFHCFYEAESFAKSLEQKAHEQALIAEIDKKNDKMA